MDEKLLEKLKKFAVERNWDKVHTEANLSRSIIIEAGELLELFQWDDVSYNKNEVCDELADILIYSLYLCDLLEVDPKTIIENKLLKVAEKYPKNT